MSFQFDPVPRLILTVFCVGVLAPEGLGRESGWLPGFQRRLAGETIEYASADPDVNSALLVRAISETLFIEWETAPVPLAFTGERATFVWLFGMAARTDTRRFDLFIDDVKWFEFTTPANTNVRDWAVAGPDGARLRFRGTYIDRYGDLFGYALLELPRLALVAGDPLRLRVVGESAGSRTWYMTFQGAVEERATLRAHGALLRGADGGRQPLVLDLVHLGEPTVARVSTSFGHSEERRLVFGGNSIPLTVPAVSEPTEVSVEIESAGTLLQQARCTVAPARPWVIHLVQHTHTDIGYTRPQTEILPEHVRFIDHALDCCDLTDALPDDARFRWTCESSWAVREFLSSRPERQVQRLLRRIAEGRIEVTAMLFNMSEVIDECSYAGFLWPVREFRDAGIPVTTAMQNDVNGVAWCLADYFGGAGIRYLIMGEHGHRAIVPFDRATAFFWESPAGGRVLAFRADHYMTGNLFGAHGSELGTVEQALFRYLWQMEEREYPSDRVAIQYSGYYTDNSPPAVSACDLIRRWNEKYEWPRLRSSIAREFLEYVDEHHADELPVYRLAWPDWWSDGFGSAARETAAARAAQSVLTAVEGLLAMVRVLGGESRENLQPAVDAIRNALILYGEHTFGSAESIREPLGEGTTLQWAEKAAYVWEAVKSLSVLRERALGLFQEFVGTSEVPVIAVVNTLNWDRSGVVEVYVDHELLPADGTSAIVDAAGREVPAQRLGSRSDGTYWALWVDSIPALGWNTYRIVPRAAGFAAETGRAGKPPGVLENEFYRLVVDPRSGAVSSLVDRDLDLELVDAGAPWQLAQLIHETLANRSQLEGFRLEEYSRTAASCSGVEPGVSGPVWQSLVVNLEAGDTAEPEDVRLEIRLLEREKRVEFLFTVSKRENFEPEALYVAFPFAVPDATVRYESLGGVVVPGPGQIPGTSSDWHAIQSFAAACGPSAQVVLASNETPLAQFGDINLGRFQRVARVERPHIYSWVMNNYWTTNFRASQPGGFRWSHALVSSSDRSAAFATRVGWSSRIPFLARVLPRGGPAGRVEPGPGTVLSLDSAGFVLVSARLARTSGGIVLLLREVQGREAAVRVDLPGRLLEIEEVSVLEEPLRALEHEVHFRPFEAKFVRLRW